MPGSTRATNEARGARAPERRRLLQGDAAAPHVDQHDRRRLARLGDTGLVERHHLRPRHLEHQRLGELLGERLVQGDDLQAQLLGGVLAGDLARLEVVRPATASAVPPAGAVLSSIAGCVESPAS